jgi:hypothetical protein
MIEVTHGNEQPTDQQPSDFVQGPIAALLEMESISPEELASALLAEYKDKDIARAQVRSLSQFLNEAAKLLTQMEKG